MKGVFYRQDEEAHRALRALDDIAASFHVVELVADLPDPGWARYSK